ncbi:uncharacterized protein N7477_002687 [Penicillium maclennaniae]|uniref:uncharacterized protein n=1 Tax=Penicillium maclennaniae TaxID=1343394 RepID=UPI002540F7DB|nr:uncharacterized protein N7477_002687 [Penicillium maclennaniae]KAJ5677054.1 hypothetical protein N7477_002687 [Penicillium maclennaniae]
MAHIIQLSLNKLLYRIKAKPKNDTVDIVWTDKLQKASTQRGQKGDIVNTLDRPKANNIYAHSTILAPKDKLQYFKRKE